MKISGFFIFINLNNRFFGSIWIFINMRKTIINEDQIKSILKLYVNEKLSSDTISKKLSIPKKRILEILKNNNIVLRSSGRQFLGGKKVADKKWRDNNKTYLSEKYKNWSENNKTHLKDYHKKWRCDNIIHHRKYKRNYEKTRKSNDPIYKLISNFRTSIYTNLKEKNITKNEKYFDILGYTINELYDHLESLFEINMSWDNYGQWHVDHILPISSFNFTTIYCEEFRKCWSLNNLQPLWASDNLSKSNKIL